MYFIRPTIITDSMLFGCNVPENEYAEWDAVASYSVGDHCQISTGGYHKLYESLMDNNVGSDPLTNYASASPSEGEEATAPWLLLGATNRWKCFDTKVGSQSSRALDLTYILQPGSIDSLGLINLDGADAKVIVSDPNSNIVDNGDDWTGAATSTPPDDWISVGGASFLIDGGALKVTAGSGTGGISQEVAVVAGTAMHLYGKYRNTAGDVAQIAVTCGATGQNIVTISGDGLVTIAGDQLETIAGTDTAIVPVTDLDSSTVESVFSETFTIPVGCTSLKLSLLAKSSADIVWFDEIHLETAVYNTTTDLQAREVHSWWDWFFAPIEQTVFNSVSAAIPVFPSCVVTVKVTSLTTAYLGSLVVGKQQGIGGMKYSPTVEIIDYSIKTTDEWGNYIITERAFAQALTCDVVMTKAQRGKAYRLFAEYRAKLLVWVGYHEDIFILYGKWDSFSITVPYSTRAICTLKVQGVT